MTDLHLQLLLCFRPYACKGHRSCDASAALKVVENMLACVLLHFFEFLAGQFVWSLLLEPVNMGNVLAQAGCTTATVFCQHVPALEEQDASPTPLACMSALTALPSSCMSCAPLSLRSSLDCCNILTHVPCIDWSGLPGRKLLV